MPPTDVMLYMDNDDDATSDPITLQFVQQNKTLIENAFKQECSDGLITVKGEERIRKTVSRSELKGVRITIQNVAKKQQVSGNALDFDCFEKKMKLNPALKDIKVGIIWATGMTPPGPPISQDRFVSLRTDYTNPIKQNSNDSQPIYLRFETEPRRVPDPSIIREALIDQGFTGASVGVGKAKKGTVDRGATDPADENVRLIEYTVSGIKAATKSSEALGGESDNRLDLEKLKKTLLLFNAMKGLLGSIVLATHVSNLVDAPLGAGSAAAVGVPTEASPYAMISGTPSAIAILLTPTQAKTKFYRDQLVNALEALARLEVVAITNRDGNERYDTMIGGGAQRGGLQKGGQQQALEPYLFVFNGTIDYPKLYDAIALQTTPPLKGLQTVMPPRTQPLYAVPSSVYQEAQRAAADALASGLAVQPPTTGMPGTYPSSDNLSEPIGRPFPIPPGEAYRGVDDEDVFMPYTTETGLRGVDIMMRQGNEVTLYRILGRDDQQLKDGYDILRSQTIGIDGLGGVKMDTQSRIDKLKQDLIRLKSRLGDYSDAEIARQLPAAQPFFRQARTDILEQIAATEKLLLKLQGTLRTTAQGPQT